MIDNQTTRSEEPQYTFEEQTTSASPLSAPLSSSLPPTILTLEPEEKFEEVSLKSPTDSRLVSIATLIVVSLLLLVAVYTAFAALCNRPAF